MITKLFTVDSRCFYLVVIVLLRDHPLFFAFFASFVFFVFFVAIS